MNGVFDDLDALRVTQNDRLLQSVRHELERPLARSTGGGKKIADLSRPCVRLRPLV
jgi:hypothetical protein